LHTADGGESALAALNSNLDSPASRELSEKKERRKNNDNTGKHYITENSFAQSGEKR
jgi:hypothetical protein